MTKGSKKTQLFIDKGLLPDALLLIRRFDLRGLLKKQLLRKRLAYPENALKTAASLNKGCEGGDRGE